MELELPAKVAVEVNSAYASMHATIQEATILAIITTNSPKAKKRLQEVWNTVGGLSSNLSLDLRARLHPTIVSQRLSHAVG